MKKENLSDKTYSSNFLWFYVLQIIIVIIILKMRRQQGLPRLFLSPLIPIDNCSWKVLVAVSNICTELINVSFCRLVNTSVSTFRSP